MKIEIRKLTPDLADDYVHFFDVTPHDVNIDEQKCYCVTWRSDDSYAHGEPHWFPTREERRARAREFVRSGSIQGYLAYYEDEIVGWCNASADCKMGVNYLRSFWPIEEYSLDVRVKSVFCFTVAPKMQRMGISTRLLEKVCEDAASESYDFVEAYIKKEYIYTDHDFRGPLEMYKKCGFSIYAEREDKAVVRKALKS